MGRVTGGNRGEEYVRLIREFEATLQMFHRVFDYVCVDIAYKPTRPNAGILSPGFKISIPATRPSR